MENILSVFVPALLLIGVCENAQAMGMNTYAVISNWLSVPIILIFMGIALLSFFRVRRLQSKPVRIKKRN